MSFEAWAWGLLSLIVLILIIVNRAKKTSPVATSNNSIEENIAEAEKYIPEEDKDLVEEIYSDIFRSDEVEAISIQTEDNLYMKFLEMFIQKGQIKSKREAKEWFLNVTDEKEYTLRYLKIRAINRLKKIGIEVKL